MKIRTIILIFACLFVIIISDNGVSSRGGRGGRYNTRSRIRYRIKSIGTRSNRGSKGAWRTGGSTASYSGSFRTLNRRYISRSLSLGIFYASLRYRSRYNYVLKEDKDEALCFNIYHKLTGSLNDSVIKPWIYMNQTVLGLYLCPLGEDDNKKYCCGDQDNERCCTFWDDADRVVEVVFLILFLLACLIVTLWFLKRWCCKNKSRITTVNTTVSSYPDPTTATTSDEAATEQEVTRSKFEMDLMDNNNLDTKQTSNDVNNLAAAAEQTSNNSTVVVEQPSASVPPSYAFSTNNFVPPPPAYDSLYSNDK